MLGARKALKLPMFLIFKLNWILFHFICVSVCMMSIWSWQENFMELALLPLCRFQWSNSDHQVCMAGIFSHWAISPAPRFLDHRAGLQSGVTAPECEGYIFSPLGLEPFISNAALHLVMPRSWEVSQGISLRSSPVIWQIARRHGWNLWIYRDFIIVALLLVVGVVVIGLSSSSLTPKVLPSVCTKLPITLARANPIRCSTLGNSHKGRCGGCLCSS